MATLAEKVRKGIIEKTTKEDPAKAALRLKLRMARVEYETKARKLRDFATAHAIIIGEYEGLKTEVKSSEEAMKPIARSFFTDATSGKHNLIDDKDVSVDVTVMFEAPEYDVNALILMAGGEKAATKLKLLRYAVNEASLESVIAQGILKEEEVAKKAILPRVRKTPSVSIKLK